MPLAPLHQPHNLAAIKAVAVVRPELPQVACFDTAFHRSQPAVAQAFALPRELSEAGIRRYGFHGLSYAYIASVLAAALGGLDGLVFTAGIGERAPIIRARVCEQAAWLGVRLDAAANEAGGPQISADHSRVSVWIIPTNEELMIARHTKALLAL